MREGKLLTATQKTGLKLLSIEAFPPDGNIADKRHSKVEEKRDSATKAAANKSAEKANPDEE